jgi:hypothetical protein
LIQKVFLLRQKADFWSSEEIPTDFAVFLETIYAEYGFARPKYE